MLSGSECDDSSSGHLKRASVYVCPKVAVDRLKNSATAAEVQHDDCLSQFLPQYHLLRVYTS